MRSIRLKKVRFTERVLIESVRGDAMWVAGPGLRLSYMPELHCVGIDADQGDPILVPRERVIQMVPEDVGDDEQAGAPGSAPGRGRGKKPAAGA